MKTYNLSAGEPLPLYLPELYLRDLQKAIKILRDNGAIEIYLFGSLISGRISKDADIDLGVIGIQSPRFFQVYAELTASIQTHIDLIDFEKKKDFFTMLKNVNEVIRIV